jgi:hypothetical protein
VTGDDQGELTAEQIADFRAALAAELTTPPRKDHQ